MKIGSISRTKLTQTLACALGLGLQFAACTADPGAIPDSAPASQPKFGSTSSDQVFVPISPCRIVDTRNLASGPISAGIARNFVFYASSIGFDWSSQGGMSGPASTTCPGTINPNGGAPSAAVVTVTVVSPTAAGNWIIWGGANPIPTTSALNWNAGNVKANTTVIPGGGRVGSGPGGAVQDFAVAYNGPSGAAHFIADVVGYLVENRATALDCYVTPANFGSVPEGQVVAVVSPACAPGYTLTSGNCGTTSAFMNLKSEYYVGSFPQAAWQCAYENTINALPNIYSAAVCCRLPGR